MSIANFERDLINKLNYKASSKISPDAVLFKAFKFFDLNGVGYVPKSQFFRTIAKIGVVLDSPQQIDQIFNYYDKKKQGKIQYVNFIEQVLFRDNNNSTTSSKQSSVSQSQYKPNPNEYKQQTVSHKSKSHSSYSTVQQISKLIKQKIRNDGLSSILKLAMNMKSLDKQRTHFLAPNKYQLVFDYLDQKQIQTLLSSFNSQKGQYNYAQIIYYLRGQQSHQTQQFLIDLFNRQDEQKQGEIEIERIIGRFNGQKRQNFKQIINTYCKFQGIDDGVFVQDDYLDFFGFIYFYFNNDDSFKRYVTNTQKEQSHKQQSIYSKQSQSQSRRQYSEKQSENKSIYAKISEQNQQINHGHNFKKNKQQFVDSPPKNNKYQKNYDDMSQDFSSEEKMSRKSIRSKTSSQITQTPNLKNILERIKGSLSNKGTMRFFLLEKALRGVDFDQDSYINLSELKKVIKDFRIGISEIETQILFQNFDINGIGLMSYPQLVFNIKGQTPQHRLKLIYRIWDRVKDSDQTTTFTKLKSIFQPRSHPDFQIAKRHQDQIKKQFIDTILLVQDLNGTRSQDIDKDTFIQYLQNVSASMEDDKFFDVAMIGLWKLSNESNIEDQYAGSRKKFQTGKKAYLQDFHKSTVIGGSSSDHAPFGTFKGPVNYTTQHRAAYQI